MQKFEKDFNPNLIPNHISKFLFSIISTKFFLEKKKIV